MTVTVKTRNPRSMRSINADYAQMDADDSRTQRYRSSDVQSDAGSFRDLLLPPALVQALAAAGFQRPSPVQKAAIPLGRTGCDMVVQAKSGTGKTAVFAAVLLERLRLAVSTPQALVIAPTRELAIQSFQVIERIAAGLPQPAPAAAVFVGGLPTEDDEKRLRRTCHVVVGTPGRLTALVASGALLTGRLTQLVLDEADQLMAPSFYKDVAWLHQQLPARKQVLAFSATFTPELMADLEPLLRRPQKVLLCEETVSLQGIRQFYKLVADSNSSSSSCVEAVAAAAAAAEEDVAAPEQPVSGSAESDQLRSEAAAPGGTAAASSSSRQPVSAAQQLMLLKVEVLLQLLSSVSFHQAVVFCNKKPAAEWLARRVSAAGCPATQLSADMAQPDRMAAMEAVRRFKVRVIVSTDIMSRGVDFDRVNLVVNLDLPPDAATYVHRVGRTGRFGSRGVAVAVVTPQELAKLKGYLQDVRGGEISALPETIPEDFYAFALESDWERQALAELLAAPCAASPPASPPPLHKKKTQQQQQDQQQQDEQEQWAEDENHQEQDEWAAGDGVAPAAAWQQQQQEEEGYDPAEAWDAWSAYYRALGYSLPPGNPYRGGSGGCDQQQQQWQQQWQQPWNSSPWPQHQWQQQWQHQGHQQQQQQQHATAVGTAAVGGSGTAAHSSSTSSSVGPAAVEMNMNGGEQAGGAGELLGPANDGECDPRALMLLSRLHVAPQAEQAAAAAAAAVATEDKEGEPGNLAPAPAAAAAAAAPVLQVGAGQQQQRPAANAGGSGVAAGAGAVCVGCWGAAFAAWRRDYESWQQQYYFWQQQQQQWHHQYQTHHPAGAAAGT